MADLKEDTLGECLVGLVEKKSEAGGHRLEKENNSTWKQGCQIFLGS
jgi:hypothetical protein